MNAFTNSLEPMPLFGLPGEVPHEQVIIGSHPSGLRSIVAIHSTARGPAFGGCRMWNYESDQAALTDALRLSQGMSFKNALANLPFGGGKAVIVAPGAPFDRAALFSSFGDLVDRADGRYITAEDVGTTTADMRAVSTRTRFVSGLARTGGFGGDPSPKTAWGVFLAIEQALRLHLGKSLAGATVAVQGLGAVGMSLCAYLADRGARLVVADINAERPDVLAPCALGAVLDQHSVPRIQAAIIAGAANNQLASPEDGDALHARGVLYVPDYLVNAGGIISVAREYLGTGDEADVMREVSLIADRVGELLERCGRDHVPARMADAWAREKLGLATGAA